MARPGESVRGTRWAIGLVVASQVMLFAGCATTTEPQLLQHPRTGHTVECDPSVQDCLIEYQVQGYVGITR